MELVVVNSRPTGKARRTTFNGRDYLVAPMTLIVPGVVPGSEGPLLYPLEELSRNYQAWNYMPIVVNHPLRAGRHVSAREPSILEESGVGFVFNTNLNGRLRAEGWFDVERTRQVDARVLDRLERGEPIELSTGLYVDTEAAPEGAVWNTPGGPRPYRAVARNYRPDHLAVLPDQRGACAVDDGCGVLVNARGDQPPDVGGEDWGSYSREEILDLLTEAALESLDGPAGNAFDPNQPRDERGRFAGADAGGALPHGERQAQRGGSVQHARDFMTKGGPATHAEVGALADHLARLTVAQLHDLRKEHGLPAQGAWKQRKPELVQTLAGRLAAHRATLSTHAARELTAAVKDNPAFTESKYRPSDAVHAYTHEGTGFRVTAHPDGRFHVFGPGLTHEGAHDTAAAAAAHASNPPPKSSPDYHTRTADVETAARQGTVADAVAHRAAQAVTPAPDAQAAARAAGQNLETLYEGAKPLIHAAGKVIGNAGRERVRQAFASTRAAFEDSRLAATAQEHGTAARRHRQAANDHGAAVEFMRAHNDTSHPAVSAMVRRHEEMVTAHRGAREHHLALADSDAVARERRLETDRPLASTYNTSISARLGTQLAGFVSAGNEWHEFTTWAHSLPPGEYTTLKGLSVNAQVDDAGTLDDELAQATVEAPPETDGAAAVAGRLLSILGDYAEPTGRLSVVANELSHSDLERRLEALLFEKYQPAGGPYSNPTSMDSLDPSPYLIDVYDDYIVYRWMDRTYSLGYTVDDQTDKVALDTADPVEVARTTEYVPVDNLLWDYETDTPLVNAKASLAGGRWVTIQGSPVYVKGDKIIAGPTRLKGTTVDASKATTHKAAPLPTGKKAAARADAATGGKGAASPASAPSPKAARAPAGKVAGKAVDPMAGHPLEGKTEDEVRDIIRRESYPTTASSRDPFKLAGHPADPALAAGVLTAVHDAQAKSSYFQPKIHELFDAARAADPSVTLLHFQRTLAAMDHAGQIRLWPYTQSINTMPRPETAMPFGYEAKHNVGPPDRRPASNMRDNVELEVQVSGPVQQVGNASALILNQLKDLTPAEACEVLSEGEFEGEELSYDEEEFLRERCSGFTANAGKGGLSTPDVTPEKACVLPGQEVQGRVSAASKAWYAGEVVRIATASGVTLSVTPNHPVMTVEGFVPAGDLQEGHDLLKYVGEDQSPVGVEDVQQAPARAEEVFVALAAGHGEEACPVGTLDFHGDAARFKGDVQIVAAHGTLRRDVVADRPQGFLQGNLVGAGEGQPPLTGGGRPGQAFGGLFAAPVGRVRRCGDPHPLLGGQVPEAEPLGLSNATEDAPGLQFAVDDGPPDANFPADPVRRNARQVEGHHPVGHVRRDDDPRPGIAPVEEFRRFGPGAELDAACPEGLLHGPRPDAVIARELLHGFTRKVVRDKVVGVERFHYEGPVYDFQSPLGYVLAQKLVISNCKILKDGTIQGKELTPRQRGLFGIICGRRKKPRGPARNQATEESSKVDEENHQRGETSMSRLTDEQRRIIVDNLVANTGCGCHGQTMPWPNERAALEKLTDNELAFADGCRKALVQSHASGPGGGSVATGPTAAQGAQQAANRGGQGQGGGPTVNVVDPSHIVVPVATPVKAPANMAEALATYGTAQDREVWNSALAIHAHEKASVIETIVANVTGEARERLIARLQTKNIDELRELAVLGAQHRVQPQPLSPAVNWFGASAAAVAPPIQEEPLTSPVYNFEFERRSA